MTNDQKQQIIERLACQYYVDHNDTYVWGTLPDANKKPYIKQAEYWNKLLRYFKLREAVETAIATCPMDCENGLLIDTEGRDYHCCWCYDLRSALKGGGESE